MMRKFLLPLMALILVSALPASMASAASLDELRKSGAIGERHDGFVAVRSNVSGAAKVAAAVNAKRRSIYQ